VGEGRITNGRFCFVQDSAADAAERNEKSGGGSLGAGKLKNREGEKIKESRKGNFCERAWFGMPRGRRNSVRLGNIISYSGEGEKGEGGKTEAEVSQEWRRFAPHFELCV